MTPLRLRIAELRRAKDLTQAELAKRAGVSRITIARMEKGHTKGVDFDTLERLARALGEEEHPGGLIRYATKEEKVATKKRGRG